LRLKQNLSLNETCTCNAEARKIKNLAGWKGAGEVPIEPGMAADLNLSVAPRRILIFDRDQISHFFAADPAANLNRRKTATRSLPCALAPGELSTPKAQKPCREANRWQGSIKLQLESCRLRA